jgi:hypothetical protein
MALWQFSNLNKYGTLRSRVMYLPDGESFSHGPGFGKLVIVKKFKYQYEHSTLPPTIFTSPNDGRVYIVPTWQEVVKGTTTNDVEWVRPVAKAQPIKSENVVVKTLSSKGDIEYITTYYPSSGKYHCTCPGTWRTGGNCKHIKELKLKNQ